VSVASDRRKPSSSYAIGGTCSAGDPKELPWRFDPSIVAGLKGCRFGLAASTLMTDDEAKAVIVALQTDSPTKSQEAAIAVQPESNKKPKGRFVFFWRPTK